MNNPIKKTAASKDGLTEKSRAILELLLLMPQNNRSKLQLYEQSCYSHWAIDQAVKQLKEHGYLRTRTKWERGRYAGHTWDVTKTPGVFLDEKSVRCATDVQPGALIDPPPHSL